MKQDKDVSFKNSTATIVLQGKKTCKTLRYSELLPTGSFAQAYQGSEQDHSLGLGSFPSVPPH